MMSSGGRSFCVVASPAARSTVALCGGSGEDDEQDSGEVKGCQPLVGQEHPEQDRDGRFERQ